MVSCHFLQSEQYWRHSSLIYMANFKPEIISPYYKLLDEDNVSACQSQGYQLIPWTVNETADMKTMLSYKVDGIITDYPDRLVELLTSY